MTENSQPSADWLTTVWMMVSIVVGTVFYHIKWGKTVHIKKAFAAGGYLLFLGRDVIIVDLFITFKTKRMTIQEVAARYNELAKQNQWDQIQDELYADHAVSIEPPHAQGLQSVEGLAAIKEKGKLFQAMIEEMHGGYCTEPVIGGTHFTVAMGMDVTMKGMGRINMDEIAIYEVKDGKIVKEQFFF
jgi:hypothetical protein